MRSKEISSLIDISNFYGQNNEYVIAGGGNTSFKDDKHIWVKASGTSLATIQENGFVCLSRKDLKVISEKDYSQDTVSREQEVKNDLAAAIVSPMHLRPSVETSMHEIIDFQFIVHTHPTYVNALMCSNNAETLTKEIFGEDVIYIEYTDPGYILFKKVLESLDTFKQNKGFSPSIIFLQNHGVFVGANSTEEISEIYRDMENKLKERISGKLPGLGMNLHSNSITEIIQKHFIGESLETRAFKGELIQHFIKDRDSFSKISKPFTPDIIVYCKSSYLFLEKGIEEKEIARRIEDFKELSGYFPKVIIVENDCMVIVEEDENSIQTVAEVCFDMMKISLLSENFVGPHTMTGEQIEFIDNWEVENYRRSVSKNT